jgi:leukotriene-A4 hydrolase
MKNILSVICCVMLILLACKNETVNTRTNVIAKDSKGIMNHSYSNYYDVIPRHLNWKANINFEKKIIEATAIWHFENKSKSNKIILDIANLEIQEVLIGNVKTNFEIGNYDSVLGSSLTFKIQPTDSIVAIKYTTTANSAALQWLTPQQTASKSMPYLFTQCEAINARSVFPCWDVPAVRITYDAQVQVPKGMLCVMSADNPVAKNENGLYNFSMKIPIPTYLIALSCGNIQYKAINNMCGVYSEPNVIEKAAKELSDIPKMIAAAEAIGGSYSWGRYDVVIQPPSFPIGGMENPKLTFATPTILAGDKSLISLIAHELAHSWSGNTVTNATWNDLWLNEGFTTYFERRIMEKITDTTYTDMLWELSYQDMMADINDLGATNLDTRLYVNTQGRDPEDAFSNIPYEKGAHLLWLIEKTVGRNVFDKFLIGYFKTNAYKPFTTAMAITYFDNNLWNQNPEWKKTVGFEEWIYEPGIPKNCPRPGTTRFAKVNEAITNFVQNKTNVNTAGINGNWSTHEWLQFLRKMPRPCTELQMKTLDKQYELTQTSNSEIAFEWFLMSLESNYKSAYPNIESFLMRVGRKKFVVPLYKAMVKQENKIDEQFKMAHAIFAKAKGNYHPATTKAVTEALK